MQDLKPYREVVFRRKVRLSYICDGGTPVQTVEIPLRSVSKLFSLFYLSSDNAVYPHSFKGPEILCWVYKQDSVPR